MNYPKPVEFYNAISLLSSALSHYQRECHKNNQHFGDNVMGFPDGVYVFGDIRIRVEQDTVDVDWLTKMVYGYEFLPKSWEEKWD